MICFYSRTTGPFSTILDTKHPWVIDIQVCSNEGPGLFAREDNYEKTKKINEIKNTILFSRQQN